jgi:large subunit ribosomal protein L6
MSRIGKKPIAIPGGVTVTRSGGTIAVKGPKGELKFVVRPGVDVKIDGNTVQVTRAADDRDQAARAMYGTTRATLQTMLTGVAQGYEKRLEIEGVGYNAKLEGKQIVLSLGWAHPVKVPVPATLTVEVPQPTQIVIRGADKQLVGELAARIRRLRKPEPYKGKGIRFQGEAVRRKAGKAFTSTT